MNTYSDAQGNYIRFRLAGTTFEGYSLYPDDDVIDAISKTVIAARLAVLGDGVTLHITSVHYHEDKGRTEVNAVVVE